MLLNYIALVPLYIRDNINCIDEVLTPLICLPIDINIFPAT
jgi:hypothetical protein